MSAGADNRAILTAAFAGTAGGDGRAFVAALADDVTWTIIGTTDWSRSYVGKAAVLTELLGPLSDQLEGSNTIVADRMIVEGDLVAVEGHGRNRTRTGHAYENRYCWVIRMGEGRMVEITEYADTQLIAQALVAPVARGS